MPPDVAQGHRVLHCAALRCTALRCAALRCAALIDTAVRCAALQAPVQFGHLVRAELPLEHSDAVLRQSPPPPVPAPMWQRRAQSQCSARNTLRYSAAHRNIVTLIVRPHAPQCNAPLPGLPHPPPRHLRSRATPRPPPCRAHRPLRRAPTCHALQSIAAPRHAERYGGRYVLLRALR